jgi:hypothetical protein
MLAKESTFTYFKKNSYSRISPHHQKPNCISYDEMVRKVKELLYKYQGHEPIPNQIVFLFSVTNKSSNANSDLLSIQVTNKTQTQMLLQTLL